MAQISRSTKVGGGTTLQANTLARAQDIETDMLALFNAHNNHDTGTSSWTVVKAEGASSVPLVSNNSTGTQNIFEAKDNGTTVLSVADGGALTVAPGGTTKAVLDTSGITLSNSATLAMGSAKITGLAAGTTNGDAVRYEQVVKNTGDETIAGTKTFSGTVLKTAQPAFLATAAGQTDITGDGTTYTVQFSTEVYDQASNFASNTTFTAPTTGRYLLTTHVIVNGLLAAHSEIQLSLVTSNRTYSALFTLGTYGYTRLTLSLPVIADMDASDTALVQLTASGGTKVVDITTGSTFSGMLLA